MTSNPFATEMAERLKSAGLEGELIKSSYSRESFGDAEAVFHTGSLVLAFVRDRGQDFLDVGSSVNPAKTYPFDDIEIAMGWTTIERILAKTEADPINAVIDRLQAHLADLQRAFSPQDEPGTRRLIEEAGQRRGEAFINHLRSLNL